MIGTSAAPSGSDDDKRSDKGHKANRLQKRYAWRTPLVVANGRAVVPDGEERTIERIYT